MDLKQRILALLDQGENFRHAPEFTLEAIRAEVTKTEVTSRTEIKTQSADGLNGTTVIEAGANTSGVTEYKPELTTPAEGRGYAQPHRALVPQGSHVFATQVAAAAVARPKTGRSGGIVGWAPTDGPVRRVAVSEYELPRYEREFRVRTRGGWIGTVWLQVDPAQPNRPMNAPVWQYFYRNDGCKALDSNDRDCLCWHDEGAGPMPEKLRADSPDNATYWRVKP